MKPFSLQFKETPAADGSVDFSQVVYDDKFNLSINKLTGRPAVDEMKLGTETNTRVTGEGTDPDRNSIGILMATETHTKSGEGVDSDPYRFRAALETATTTFVSNEGADSDK